MHKLVKTLTRAGAFALLLAPGAGYAQVALDLEMEGPITNYTNGPGQRPVLEVMGVPLTIIPNQTNMTSPTTSRTDLGLGVNQWFRGPRLAGRNDRGFLGGTAIVTGTVTPDGEITVTDIFTEPAENVVLGVISTSSCSVATCSAAGDSITMLVQPLGAPADGLLALPSQDQRIAFTAPVGEFGFDLNLAGADLAGFGASVEGYYGEFSVTGAAKPELHFFSLEISDGGALLANPEVFEVAATRAQCRQRDVNEFELEVRGSTHIPVSLDGAADPTSGVIGLQDQNGVSIALDEVAEIDALAEAGDPNIFGGFRIRIDDRAGTCPTAVTLTWTGADGQIGTALSAPFDVDIRDDTAG